jgi:HAD superfamily hydrolase (TIGR01484 family)
MTHPIHQNRSIRYFAFATDYDGTLATHGQVTAPVIQALKTLRSSGRKLILVTGRILDDLKCAFSQLDLFDLVIAENGALLYRPFDGVKTLATRRIPREFIEKLQDRGVTPLDTGEVIAATREPHETAVLSTIRDTGLELEIIFNKGAVMILPAGVNKATGLKLALKQLGLSAHNTIGVGDAENDYAFLQLCECSVAVANALPSLKERADLVTAGRGSEGVVELIDRIVTEDPANPVLPLSTRDIRLGSDSDGRPVGFQPGSSVVMIAGASGSGKTRLANAIIEQLVARAYQFALFDPEGDYEGIEGVVELGSPKNVPDPEAINQLLEPPEQSVSVNLVAVPLSERPGYLARIWPMLQSQREQYGRPHNLILDEAHHLLPKDTTFPPWESQQGLIFITMDPRSVDVRYLQSVDVFVAIGESGSDTIRQFQEALEVEIPAIGEQSMDSNTGLVYFRNNKLLVSTRLIEAQRLTPRHRRKYAEGKLPRERSFYFRGPDNALNLRADNLQTFIMLASGLDDATWLYHLGRREYSKWIKEMLKDDSLADAVLAIETSAVGSAGESRSLIIAEIEKRYTAPES